MLTRIVTLGVAPYRTDHLEDLPLLAEQIRFVATNLDTTRLCGGDVDVGAIKPIQLLLAPVGCAVRGDLHGLAIVRRHLDARLRLARLEVDDPNSLATELAGNIHGAGEAVIQIDDAELALDELDLLGSLPVEDRLNVNLQFLWNRNALEILVESLVDLAAEIGSLLHLDEGILNDALRKVIV